ncbi:transposase [Streptomyces sp. NBRC 110611]|uniref:transposase n=1 Tax=Streptomyces sp. NBRC 110611 TaxID=1621259 RepID=UPI00082E8301|nr:transposase [Streptomyces sp. NBRC 110611]
MVRIRGRPRQRVSLAALCCYRPGERSRLIYRYLPHKSHDSTTKAGRCSFTWTDYRDLLIAAHQQPGAPIVLIWDNLNTHRAASIRGFIAAHDWITAFYLPPYAPNLNPVEGIWSLLRRSAQNNTALANHDHLICTLRHGLRTIQYRSHLIDGCLTGTAPAITKQPTTSPKRQ